MCFIHQPVASAIYVTSSRNDLNRWSSHSIRVMDPIRHRRREEDNPLLPWLENEPPRDSVAITRVVITLSKGLDGLEHLTIYYRRHKNGQNGEKVLYGAASQGYPYRCPVIAMRNILRRAESLGIQITHP